MKLPSREFLQSKGRPAIQALLASDHAQDVLIRRPGQPDVRTRAVVMPWNSDAGSLGTVDQHGIWMGVLAHDALSSPELDFLLVIGADAYAPKAVPEDAGGAGVAWLLRLAPVADPAYPLQGAWTDGTVCRFKVGELQSKATSPVRELVTSPMPSSLRELRVHPADAQPQLLAAFPYQDGHLVLGLWSDRNDLTGQRVGVCRLVDERAYPAVAGLSDGQSIRLRIQALDTAALSGGGEGLKVDANDSHRAFLPPGIALQVGDVLTLSGGDQYQVVPPVQRDALGDTLGLSWMGSEVSRTPTEGNDPTPDVPAPEQPAPEQAPPGGYDPWWDSK